MEVSGAGRLAAARTDRPLRAFDPAVGSTEPGASRAEGRWAALRGSRAPAIGDSERERETSK